MKLKLYILSLIILLFSCANKKTLDPDISKKNSQDINKTSIKDSDPFYPLKESMEDIQNQMIDLKSKVIEYESRLHHPTTNLDLLKLIKMPNLKHEIIMTNGTIIQGTIIFESDLQMVIKTQIGQLTIEKEFIAEIKEIEPIQPYVEFKNEQNIEERILENGSITYNGEIINNGGRRADFVRVVYHFWANDTSPIYSDSTYVLGNSTIYLNGVISDAAIEPTETATFNLNIQLPDSLKIEYLTKEIKWDIFD